MKAKRVGNESRGIMKGELFYTLREGRLIAVLFIGEQVVVGEMAEILATYMSRERVVF
jgi:hypothetical protein